VGTSAQDLAYIRQFVGLSDDEMARLFGTTPGELRTWLETDEIPALTAGRIRAVADVVRRSAADPTRLGVARELTARRDELDGRSVLEEAAESAGQGSGGQDPA
jgi:hypothetical protein